MQKVADYIHPAHLIFSLTVFWSCFGVLKKIYYVPLYGYVKIYRTNYQWLFSNILPLVSAVMTISIYVLNVYVVRVDTPNK